MEERTLLCTRCNYEFVTSVNPDIPLETFRSTSAPTHTYVTLQRQLLHEESYILQRYDKEITQIQSTLARLESDRFALQERMSRRCSLLSSQRKIPLEIWEQIFTEACFWDNTGTRVLAPLKIDRNSLQGTPLTLSRTCTSWRRMIRDISGLWSGVALNLPSLQVSNYPLIPAALDFVLDRARSSPLALSIPYDGWGTPLPPALADLILRAFSQSRELEIRLRFLKTVDLASQTSCLPRLESLAILVDESYSCREDVHTILRHSPVLKSLVVDNKVVRWIPSGSTPSSLSTQSVECLFAADVLTLSQCFPSLTTLSLFFDHISNPDLDNLTMVKFSSLTSLICTIHTEHESPAMYNISTFLGNIILPSLTSFTLTVESVNGGETYDFDYDLGGPIIDCIERSNCGSKLKNLNVSMPTYYLNTSYSDHDSSAWILKPIDLAPGLEVLSLEASAPFDGDSMSDTTVYDLLGQLSLDESCALFPSLRRLSIGISHLEFDEESTIVAWEMIDRFCLTLESRAACCRPLESAELNLDGWSRGQTQLDGEGDKWCGVVRRVEALECNYGTKCVIYAPNLT